MKTGTRRLRGNETLRRMVRETRVSGDSLVYPLFIREGSGIEEELPSLPGQARYSPDTVAKGIDTALNAGARSFLLFGIPETKDERGSGACDDDGVIQQALRNIKRAFGDAAYLITDVCLCEYTTHGHCGLIRGGAVDNDATLPLLSRTAVSHARSGADMVAPSAMMDGTVAAVRAALDAEGFKGIPIMSYAAKYASAFYGPFREAAGSAPRFGDRKTYQMDYHNGKEALKRIEIDIGEGADIVIVKPALPCLDIIHTASQRIKLPIAGYSVSGEYAMIKAAAARGFIDEYNTMCESAVAVFRAGADILITYFAKELAGAIRKGDIG
ncbi:MAG: porphobilinogen synthase [Chitinispirillales bacterium]|jgi:porphobilinogen synthase|nr:porphobilinogen synthase [Chitinispirillales bacterium]